MGFGGVNRHLGRVVFLLGSYCGVLWLHLLSCYFKSIHMYCLEKISVQYFGGNLTSGREKSACLHHHGGEHWSPCMMRPYSTRDVQMTGMAISTRSLSLSDLLLQWNSLNIESAPRSLALGDLALALSCPSGLGWGQVTKTCSTEVEEGEWIKPLANSHFPSEGMCR